MSHCLVSQRLLRLTNKLNAVYLLLYAAIVHEFRSLTLTECSIEVGQIFIKVVTVRCLWAFVNISCFFPSVFFYFTLFYFPTHRLRSLCTFLPIFSCPILI